MAKAKLRLIPLGGLGEIGKNMMLLEYGDDIIAIDIGLMFPEEDMLGVDLVIPDASYLFERKHRLRGIIITHGHEDHIGALPYILPYVNAPLYSTKLTQSLISLKLKEHKLLGRVRLETVGVGEKVTLGKFQVRFFRACHSIPDSAGLVIETPLGTIVHSGDFKLDYTPVDGNATDLSLLAQLGAQGVLLLLSDSTYAEVPGYTPTEKLVGETLDQIIAQAPGRVIIATFASLISRVQQVLEMAARHGRRVFVVGRSMSEISRLASEMGYLKAPPGTLARIEELPRLPLNRVVLLVTGTQGEPTSALVRMANRDHPQLHILKGDTVVVSATPIPGNETLVSRTLDNLFRQGASVHYGKIAPVHVHGHASQEELKLLINLVKPRYFVPIHGEYRHLSLHAQLAVSMGVPRDNVFVMEDGDILEFDRMGARMAGKAPADNVYVDGLGMEGIGTVVLRDRQALAQDGIVVVIVAVDKRISRIVGTPDIVSRGFVDPEEARDLMEESRKLVAEALAGDGEHITSGSFITAKVKDLLGNFFYKQTRRRPMILPVVVEV